MIGFGILSGVFIFSSVYLTLKNDKYKKEIEYLIKDSEAKKKYDENQISLNTQKSNKELITKLSPLLNGVSYIKDNNGELVFFNNDFELINVSTNAVVELLNEEKVADSVLYDYNTLYKVYDVNTKEGKSNYINKNDKKEVLSIPDNILVGFGDEQKSIIPEVKINLEDKINEKFISSEDGLITKFDDWDNVNFDSCYKIKDFRSIRDFDKLTPTQLTSFYDRSEEHVEYEPSEYAYLGGVNLEDVGFFISKDLIKFITEDTSQFRFILSSGLNKEDGWRINVRPNQFGISYRNDKSFYSGVYPGSKEVTFNLLSVKFIFLKENEDENTGIVSVLSPKVKINPKGEKLEIYIY